MARISVCVCVILLLVCGVVPALAQQPADLPSDKSPAPPATITGSGTAGFVPVFTGPTTIGNSKIFQTVGTNVGIGTAAPAAKLDVNGTENVRDTLSLFPKLTHPTLAVRGTAFAVSNTGKVTFVAGQNFPGTGTVTSVGSGFGLTGGPITHSGTLAINTSVVPQLGTSNTFTGNQSVNGNISATGTISTPGTITTPGTVDAGVVQGFFLKGTQMTFNGSVQYLDDGVGGDLQPPLLINAVDCCNFGNRMIWSHSPSFINWGVYYDDINDIMRWRQDIGADQMILNFNTGELDVLGAITAGTKDFKIDHPLDPKNKYLYHGSVESSEMMNIYTGNAILDNAGEVVVSLPKWFEALNTDFRYQLTAIGAAAPNLHVAEKVRNNSFRIAGGQAGMEVSWQVTGVRHDAYAKAHPLVVEVAKPKKERGHYRNPEAFGAPRLTQEQMLQAKSKP